MALRWKLFQPADWVPLWMEDIFYRAPDDSQPILSGTVLSTVAAPGKYLIGVKRRTFLADARDVFPTPGWKREREERAREEEETNQTQ